VAGNPDQGCDPRLLPEAAPLLGRGVFIFRGFLWVIECLVVEDQVEAPASDETRRRTCLPQKFFSLRVVSPFLLNLANERVAASVEFGVQLEGALALRIGLGEILHVQGSVGEVIDAAGKIGCGGAGANWRPRGW